MPSVTKLELPFSAVNVDELVSVLYRVSDYIAIHEVIVDEWESICDSRLVWWNHKYEGIRTKPVEFGQLMSQSYFEAHSAMAHVTEAWNTGHSIQVFEMSPETNGFYSPQSTYASTWVTWQRLGDHIVEVGCDVDEANELRDLINDQQTLVAVAARKRVIAVERERIARNLHDVVIQNLYATSLSLAVAGRGKDEETQGAFKKAISAIDEVISEIRREILHVESRKASPLRLQLEDVLIPVLHPTRADLDLLLEITELPANLESHVRAVCSEAASNAVRHGKATDVKIRLSQIKKDIFLIIEDNGIGMSPHAQLQNGLHNMRERAESLGGTMEIQPSTTGGTTVTWSVPSKGSAS